MRIGYFLSCEEYSPEQLVEQAVAAEAAGSAFTRRWLRPITGCFAVGARGT